MNRGEIIQFTGKMSEAHNVLEEANERETARVERVITDADKMLEALHVRHSELMIFVEDIKREMDRSIRDIMTAWMKREAAIRDYYKQRLIELKETPPPKLIVDGEER